MRRSVPAIATLVCVAASGCASSASVIGSAQPTGDPYRLRVIDQLDLPVNRFDGWEVVDAAKPSTPPTRRTGATDVNPPTCAPGGTLAAAADAPASGSVRWTGTSGTGPAGERFDVSLVADNDAPLTDIGAYTNACARFTHNSPLGPATAETVSYVPADRGDFTDVAGYSTATTYAPIPGGPPPGTSTTTTLVGRVDSLTMTVVFTNPGAADRDRIDTLWRTAVSKFERTG